MNNIETALLFMGITSLAGLAGCVVSWIYILRLVTKRKKNDTLRIQCGKISVEYRPEPSAQKAEPLKG